VLFYISVGLPVLFYPDFIFTLTLPDLSFSIQQLRKVHYLACGTCFEPVKEDRTFPWILAGFMTCYALFSALPVTPNKILDLCGLPIRSGFGFYTCGTTCSYSVRMRVMSPQCFLYYLYFNIYGYAYMSLSSPSMVVSTW
jgi:hypothetical protein